MKSESPGESGTKVDLWLKNYLSTGNTKFWGYIFETYKKNIYHHCLRILHHPEDARDITSEVFIKAFENISKYESSRPFYPWLSQIATNLCIDSIRRKKRASFEHIDNLHLKDSSGDIVHTIENVELSKRMNNAIHQLKRVQKRCFCLFYVQQKTYKEIAELTGFSLNEVRSYIQNGKRKFKLIMEGYS